jgi:putative tryptophan/tyrosine transport system substrate-binding protein
VKRREFITLIGGAAATWPLAARAQQLDRVRRIGVLMGLASSDMQQRVELTALTQELQKLGWGDGRNVRIYYRWGDSDADRTWTSAKELIELQPDVIVAHTTSAVSALAQQTRTIPIVFVLVSDPVGNGFVENWTKPGGNITGFTDFEPPMAGKWLELLKQTAPHVTQVALLFNPETAPGGGSIFLDPIEKAAPAFALNWIAAAMRSTDEIETIGGALGRHGATGLLVTPDIFTAAHLERIIALAAVMPDSFPIAHRAEITSLAARHRLPAVYPFRFFAEVGGLLAYGVDLSDNFRRAASYADRILKGEKPGELPVQGPAKFEFVINLKTAKAMGLDVPPTLLARADEVIE